MSELKYPNQIVVVTPAWLEQYEGKRCHEGGTLLLLTFPVISFELLVEIFLELNNMLLGLWFLHRTYI